MDPKHLEALIEVERSYWWHVAKRELVLSLLARHAPPPGVLVEGGVGGGANALKFRDLGYEVHGFDLMPEAVEHCQNMGLGDFQVLDLGNPWPVEPGTAKAVVMLDVIEHVPDPVRVLSNAAAALAPEGKVIVTVPAIPALMGPWDRMLGHYRRYSRRMFREHARGAGLRVNWLSHWNSFTLPPAIAVRTMEKVRGMRRSAEFPPVSKFVNSLLVGMARLERGVMPLVPIPLGLSLVGVLTHERRSHGRSEGQAGPARVGRPAGIQRGSRAAGAGAERH